MAVVQYRRNKDGMRRILVKNHMSLDGYFEGPNKEIDWFGFDDDQFQDSLNLVNSVDTLLFGRVTYEMMKAHWTVAPPGAICDKMNSLAKIVFSSTLNSADWNNTRVVNGNVAEEARRLKQEPGGDMVVLGSGKLASLLLQRGLVDEYRVYITPILLGAGTPLFHPLRERVKLKRAATKIFNSGIVMHAYQKAE
jgi:dihydrofolate reductase